MSKLYLCFYIPGLNKFVVFNSREVTDKEYKNYNVLYSVAVKYAPHDISQEEIFIEEEIDEDGDVINIDEYVMYKVPINQINNIKVHPRNLSTYKILLECLNE